MSAVTDVEAYTASGVSTPGRLAWGSQISTRIVAAHTGRAISTFSRLGCKEAGGGGGTGGTGFRWTRPAVPSRSALCRGGDTCLVVPLRVAPEGLPCV